MYTGEKDHVCVTCGKSFHRAYDLARHKLAHSDPRPYVCETCGKTFRQACGLKLPELALARSLILVVCATRHLYGRPGLLSKRIHTNVKPYTCTVCGKSFMTYGQIKTHEMSRSREKPHVCTICSERFTPPHHRMAHEKTHGIVVKKCVLFFSCCVFSISGLNSVATQTWGISELFQVN